MGNAHAGSTVPHRHRFHHGDAWVPFMHRIHCLAILRTPAGRDRIRRLHEVTIGGRGGWSIEHFDSHPYAEAMIPRPTADQKQALRNDLHLHRAWLDANKIKEPLWALKSEKQYTGVLLAALLDSDASATVCRALLACKFGPMAAATFGHPKTVHCPDKGPDLVAILEHEAEEVLLIVEHKRFGSPSHAPGHETDPDAPWQTDRIYAEATQKGPPLWLSVAGATCKETYFIVLDAHGMSMEQLFPDGEFNEPWMVTSYPQFGAVLRKDYERGVRGLVPLLATLYAGRLRSIATNTLSRLCTSCTHWTTPRAGQCHVDGRFRGLPGAGPGGYGA